MRWLGRWTIFNQTIFAKIIGKGRKVSLYTIIYLSPYKRISFHIDWVFFYHKIDSMSIQFYLPETKNNFKSLNETTYVLLHLWIACLKSCKTTLYHCIMQVASLFWKIFATVSRLWHSIFRKILTEKHLHFTVVVKYVSQDALEISFRSKRLKYFAWWQYYISIGCFKILLWLSLNKAWMYVRLMTLEICSLNYFSFMLVMSWCRYEYNKFNCYICIYYKLYTYFFQYIQICIDTKFQKQWYSKHSFRYIRVL